MIAVVSHILTPTYHFWKRINLDVSNTVSPPAFFKTGTSIVVTALCIVLSLCASNSPTAL